MSQLNWFIDSPSQNKVETMEAPQNRRFYGMIECLPFWPTYRWGGGGLWAKHMGLKRGAIGNTLGEPIGNLKGTFWEQRENEKKSRHFECILSLPIGCMKFLFCQNCLSPFCTWAKNVVFTYHFINSIESWNSHVSKLLKFCQLKVKTWNKEKKDLLGFQ
jgi:hypothetical protein